MKKLLLTTLLIGVTTLTMAKEIDLTESKGIDQEVIVSFNPTPASLTVDKNITFKIIFNVDLDEKHVKKNDIQLQNISDNPRNIEGNVAYIADEKAVTFKAEQPLTEGYYEIEFKSLKATKANKDEQIKEIKYRFYVPEVINGHMLPPVPDETLNNSTVFGIDVNDNGVRDDVERWIYTTYDNPIEQAIFMQNAYAYQKVIENPSEAHDTTKYIDDAYSCESYWTFNAKKNNELFSLNKYRDLEKEIRAIQFNTINRHMAYQKFNATFHGEVFSAPEANKEKCNFDIDALIGGE